MNARGSTMTDGTIGSVLRRQVTERGGMTMLVCDDERLTYSDAETRSSALARGLVALGANRGTHVGILFPTGVDFVVSWLAVTRVGAVAVPISTFSTEDEIRGLLAAADIDVLLTVAEYRGHDYLDRLHHALDLDLTRPGEYFLPAAPSLRRVFVAGTTESVHAEHTIGALCDLGSAVDDAAFRGGRSRCVAGGSHGDRLHLGFDERAQGCGACARHAHSSRRQPQPTPWPVARA